MAEAQIDELNKTTRRVVSTLTLGRSRMVAPH